MFLVNARAHEFDDRYVMSRLRSGAESVAEHEAQRRFEHRLVGLFKAGFFVEIKNFFGGSKLFFRRLAGNARFASS